MKLLLIILLPLLTIALLPVKKFSRLAFYISVCLLGISNIVLLSTLKMHFSQIIFNQYFVLLIDKYAWFFAMVVNICWILTTIYSYSFVRYDFRKKAKKFHFFLAFILSTVLGGAFSGNLITLFMFYILSIPLIYPITAILTGTPTSILGAKLHIITHSIAKCCLFFIAGFYNCAYSTVNTSQVARISPYKKWITVSVLISGLSIAGFPFLAGYLSKDLMLIEELHSGNYAAAIFLVSGSILNLFYILPLAKASFFNPKPEEIENRAIPLSMKIAIILATLIIIAISIYTYTVVRVIESF